MKIKTKLIQLFCENCNKELWIRKDQFDKRKTKLCKSCMISERNKTPKMRDISRKNGRLSPSEETKKKLSLRQKEYWTKEKIELRKGSSNPSWLGGRIIVNGYVLCYCPNHPKAYKKGQYVQEHILIMEKHIGRFLNKKEIVHHINKDRSDNRIENLQLMTQSNHVRLHNLERKKE